MDMDRTPEQRLPRSLQHFCWTLHGSAQLLVSNMYTYIKYLYSICISFCCVVELGPLEQITKDTSRFVDSDWHWQSYIGLPYTE